MPIQDKTELTFPGGFGSESSAGLNWNGWRFCSGICSRRQIGVLLDKGAEPPREPPQTFSDNVQHAALSDYSALKWEPKRDVWAYVQSPEGFSRAPITVNHYHALGRNQPLDPVAGNRFGQQVTDALRRLHAKLGGADRPQRRP